MNHIDELKDTAIQKANESLEELKARAKRINTFDLIANISFIIAFTILLNMKTIEEIEITLK